MTPDGSRATGVVLENGERLTADVVVNNSDLVYAYNNLLPEMPYAKSLSQRPASCSSISFYWALDRKVEQLEAHNIFLADEYKESFDSIFKKHLIPNEPSFYVNVPSRVDPTAAPTGKDTIVVLVPVGHLLDSDNDSSTSSATEATKEASNHSTNGDATKLTKSDTSKGVSSNTVQDWPSMIALARRTIIATIAARTGVDITPFIVYETTNDPFTWQQRFNLDKGAILGLSHSFFNVLSFRPSTRARRGGWLDGKLGGGIVGQIGEVLNPGGRIDGLYMVGASSHPGTGVPICLAGGKLVAEQVCEDLGMRVPWRSAEREGRERMEGKAGKTGYEIDVVRGGPVLSWVHWVLVAVLAVLIAVFTGTFGAR